MRLFCPCVDGEIDIEPFLIERGFLLDLEAHYKCPVCEGDHVVTIDDSEDTC